MEKPIKYLKYATQIISESKILQEVRRKPNGLITRHLGKKRKISLRRLGTAKVQIVFENEWKFILI